MMSVWICVMSLVVRVMSDEVENLSNSGFEKSSIFLKTSLLSTLQTPEDIRAERKLTITVATALRSVRMIM